MEGILERKEREKRWEPSLDSQIIWFLIGCVIAMILISICSPVVPQENSTYDLLVNKENV